MRILLLAIVGCLFSFGALAQPVCTTAAPNAIACQPPASNLQPTDVLLGQQAQGPDRANQTVRVPVSELGGTWNGGTVTAPATFSVGTVIPSSHYDATAFGSCTWDASHDVGPCINAAYAACVTGNGGLINIPAGNYGFATAIANHKSGCSIAGLGVGDPRDAEAPSSVVGITKLTWIGSAYNATPAFQVSPATPTSQSLYSASVTGIAFDCASLVDVCVDIEQDTNAFIIVLGAEARLNNVILNTFQAQAGADAPGNQFDDIWVYSRSTSATYSPTGILFDSGIGGTFNTSINRIHNVYAWFAKGDGVVFGNSDNNLVEVLATFQDPTNKGGLPCVFANASYVQKNGVVVNGSTNANIVQKTETFCAIQGFQTASTVTPGGGNAGSAALNTVTLTTTATTAQLNQFLNFSGGTTNVLPGMTANAGNWTTGVPPGVAVQATTGTTVTMSSQSTAVVAIGTNVIFGYGITGNARTGTYTMTAVDATHWSLTAPSGGHTQTDIAVASGAVTFTDMVIPLTGTPVAGDTFTIVVPQASANNTIGGVDKGNSNPNPMVEPGAAAFMTTTSNPWPQMFGGTGNIAAPCSQNATNCATQIGGNGGLATGFNATSIGGISGVASGFGAATYGGQNDLATGPYSLAVGESTAVGGQASQTGGFNSTDRGRFAERCWASGAFAVQGDAQICPDNVLRGTTSNNSPVNLTADGTGIDAAFPSGNSNCINIPVNTQYAITITLVAVDHISPVNNYTATWGLGTGANAGPHLMTRQALASSTLIDGVNTAISPDSSRSNGTVTGIAATIVADQTIGCMGSLFTPPTGNSHQWDAVAHVTTVEVQ